MERAILAISMVLLGVLLISVANGQLASTPWPMFRHDLQHTAVSALNGPPSAGILWSYSGGSNPFLTGVASSAAVGTDGRVYLGSLDNSFYTLTSSGALVWSYATNRFIFSSPAIDNDGRLYVGSQDNNLYVFSSVGSLDWSYSTAARLFASVALGTDGTVHFGSQDNKLYATASTGILIWSYATGGDLESSPALATDGTIYLGSLDNVFYAFGSSGTLSWSYTTDDYIASSPSVGAQGTVYIPSIDSNLYAVASNGSLAWSYVTGGGSIAFLDIGAISSPAIGTDGTIYLGSDDFNLYALTSSGTLRWSYTTGSFLESSPNIGQDGTIYFGGLDTNLYALNSNGTLKWSFGTGSYIGSSLVIGPKERIYVGTLSLLTNRPDHILCISKHQPLMNVILSNDTPAVGDTLTIDLTVASIGGAVDGYAGIGFPNGEFYSFVLGKPTVLKKGVHALATKVKGLTETYSTRLYSIQVPQGAAGIYTVLAGLVPEGVTPTVANTIPEYYDQELLTVH